MSIVDQDTRPSQVSSRSWTNEEQRERQMSISASLCRCLISKSSSSAAMMMICISTGHREVFRLGTYQRTEDVYWINEQSMLLGECRLHWMKKSNTSAMISVTWFPWIETNTSNCRSSIRIHEDKYTRESTSTFSRLLLLQLHRYLLWKSASSFSTSLWLSVYISK